MKIFVKNRENCEKTAAVIKKPKSFGRFCVRVPGMRKNALRRNKHL
jgi:hypothetical protein